MSDLYIMERSDALGIVKIGSSSNPERRRRDLQQSHEAPSSVSRQGVLGVQGASQVVVVAGVDWDGEGVLFAYTRRSICNG